LNDLLHITQIISTWQLAPFYTTGAIFIIAIPIWLFSTPQKSRTSNAAARTVTYRSTYVISQVSGQDNWEKSTGDTNILSSFVVFGQVTVRHPLVNISKIFKTANSGNSEFRRRISTIINVGRLFS